MIKPYDLNPGGIRFKLGDPSVCLGCEDTSFYRSTGGLLFYNVNASTDVTLSAGQSGGIFICADDANESIAQNGIYAEIIFDTSRATLTKRVAGVDTELINVSITYEPNKKLKLIKSGDQVSLFYNGTFLGTTQTISDASIINNTIHGVFGDSGDFTNSVFKPFELGTEKLINFDFSGTWGPNDVPQGWSRGGTITANTFLQRDEVNDRLRIKYDSSDVTNITVFQNVVSIEKIYQCEVDIFSVSGQAKLLNIGGRFGNGSNEFDLTTPGTPLTFLSPGSVGFTVGRKASGIDCDIWLNSVSVKEVV
jgi:hypothetical protein